MDTDQAARELDEDCAVLRVRAAIRGDKMLAKMDDALRRAIPLCERGEISPLAMFLIGVIFRDREYRGLSLEESKHRFVRLHDGSAEMAAGWERAVEQLSLHNLLPAEPN